MPAGSAMTSASARQARCINRAAEAWLHSALLRKSPAVKRGYVVARLLPERDLPPGGARTRGIDSNGALASAASR